MIARHLLLPPRGEGRFGLDLPRLAAAEAACVTTWAGTGVRASPALVDRAGIAYIALEGEFSHGDLDVVARLCGARALFAERDDAAFVGVELPSIDTLPPDLVTIQRYPGKTNEAFTRMLLNVTSAAASIEVRRVLDPLAGRGTTLNLAALLGFDTWGVESDAKAVDAHVQFFIRWLEDHRIKHRVERTGLRCDHGAGKRVTLHYGPARDRIYEVACADTRDLAEFHRDRSIDIVVADLPYGVRHKATSASRERGPGPLLIEALPSWRQVLKERGALGMSFNVRTLPRSDLESLLDDAGFVVAEPPAGADFEHVVDRSITRDLVVARPA